MSDIGASELGRWQFWQLRWRIGAMSLVKVTAGCAAALAWPLRRIGVASEPATSSPDNASKAVQDGLVLHRQILQDPELSRRSIARRSRDSDAA